MAVIIQDGLRRMVKEQEDVFYYITLMNENYAHPALPAGDGAREGIVKGMYKLTDGGESQRRKPPRVQLLGSGVILREVIAAAELLKTDWGVTSDIWSCPSFNELGREGRAVTRWNMLHPTEKQRVSWVVRAGSRARRVRSSPPPTTSGRSPIRSASWCRGATRCWAPTGSGAAIRARTCGASSR